MSNNEKAPTVGIKRHWVHQTTIVVAHETEGENAVQSKVTKEFYEKVLKRIVASLDDLPEGMTVQVVDSKTIRLAKGPGGMMMGPPGMGPE